MEIESGENRSRKALSTEEDDKLLYSFRFMNEETFLSWFMDNIDVLKAASERTRNSAEKKFTKHYPDQEMPDIHPPNPSDIEDAQKAQETETQEVKTNKAPGFISERYSSEIPLPPESKDVIYLSEQEITLGEQVNTLRDMLVHDPDLPNSHTGPWIERCMGRDPETKKLQVARLKARWVPIEPWMVMTYLGNVVEDKQSVHTSQVWFKKVRHGYTFDKFYIDPRNTKKYNRCCIVMDKIHQAGLMYEKMVSKQTRKRFARIRQIRGPLGKSTGNPMYKVVGYQEADYRDLKRLFERHFLYDPKELQADDIGLKLLISG